MPASPNVVLVHGAWADGSSWSAVVERLQADGYNVTAPQFGLTALADDVERLRHVLRLQSGPTLVAGHSYGGQIMTALGADAPNAIGLVYIAAFGLDEGESIGGLLAQGPPTPALANLSIDDKGFAWLPQDDFVGHFAADVDPVQARVMHAVQQPLHTNALGRGDGCPGLEVAAVLVPGRRRRPGDPARRRAAVRPAHGRDHGRGRDQPRRDGLPPRRRGGAHRDGGRGGAGDSRVGLRPPGKIQAMASYSVNERGVERARQLIDARQYVLDSEWGAVQPRAADENAFLESHSWDEYSSWHLGLTDGANDETKARYAFVYGDFRRIHRMGLIACHYRAAEWRHKEIELAAHDLLQLLDAKSVRAARSRARGRASCSR